MTISSFHAWSGFSTFRLEQPEEEEEEEEEEERERNVCGRARAREAGESRRGALLRASEAALSSSIKI